MTTFAAITTRELPVIADATPLIAVRDGNGRTSTFQGVDRRLGKIAQHRQALQAHTGDLYTEYVAGYLDDDPDGWTVAWVRTS